MSFDRVADIYDATRGVPPAVQRQRSERIIAATHASPETRFLELGVGTGRIALPFVERGYRYTGVDVSQAMMDRLRAQLPEEAPNLTLVQADVTELPFPDQSFDVVLVYHVFHLMPEWRRALREAQRVLTPRGYFIIGGDGASEGEPEDQIRQQWRTFAREAGVTLPKRHAEREDVFAALTEERWRTAVFQVARWQEEVRPIELIERRHRRVHSETWEVPDRELEEIHERMVAWARERYGDPDRAIQSRSDAGFAMSWRDPSLSTKPVER